MASALIAKPARASVRASRASRARTVSVRAAARPTWYPGATPAPYLDGSLPGDYGFDPLRLGENPERLAWYRCGEIYNGQIAMTAIIGMAFTDAVGLPNWWEAGAETYALDFNTLAAIELAVFAVLEYKRYEGFKKTGGSGVLGFFPFDPLGLASEETKVKEIKNGRLAMVACLGSASQAAVQGLGPVSSLKYHLEDPGKHNIFTSSVGTEATIAVIALCITPITIELTRYVGGGAEPRYPWKENA